MTTLLNDDQLDAALDRLLHDEPLESILVSYPSGSAEMRPLLTLASLFESIRSVELPPAESLAADRNEFLAELTSLQLQPVSPSFLSRLKGRVSQYFIGSSPTSTQQQKEMRNMSVLLLKAALIITIAFGSLGGTMAAAAGSLPDSVVYPVKLAMEQARLTLADNPAREASMHLAFAGERTREIVRLAAKGEVPDEALLNRFQNHMGEAYHLAAQMGDQEMKGLLLQAQEMIQTQSRDLERVQEKSREQVQEQKQEQKQDKQQEQLHQQIQTRLNEASQLMNRWRQEAENGLQDPVVFRLRFGQNRPDDAPLQPEVAPNDEPAQKQYQGGQDGESPGPGQPGGNPDCPVDCEPEGDKHQYGPGSEDQPGGPSNGPGQPGGNPDCDGDCEPLGDENKYGPGSEDPPPAPSSGPGQPGGNPDCQSDCDGDPDRDQQRDQDKDQDRDQDRDGLDSSGNGQQGDNSSGSGEPGGNPDSGTPADTGGSGSGDSGGNPDSGSGGSGDPGGPSGSSTGTGGSASDENGSGSSGGSGGGQGK